MKTPEKYVKALSSVERHYSQIKYEALAIAWGCHHFRMYLLWSHCKVVTDHKSLLAILNSPISKAFARIENWRLKFQSFNFEVLYSIGDLNPADYIIRHLKGDTKCDNRRVRREVCQLRDVSSDT